ncbi:MAG: helicase C-terminal domain-containing protein, partial [Opitutales bacterium]
DQQGHLPVRTILIVDEAHNLPARVASSLSPCFDDGATARLRFELRELGNFKTLDGLLGKWGRFLSMRRSGEVLDLEVVYEATDLLEQFSEILTVHPLPHDKFTFENFNLLWEYARAYSLLEDGSPRQMWAPDDGKLEIACLDASKHIEEKLSAFGLRVLTSATLEPIDEFATECGLCSDSYEVIHGKAPWRKGAFKVAVDARVDTRFSSRSEHYQLTAETISAVAEKAGNPVVAFFPSYRYAEEIYDLLSEKAGQSVKLQPRLSKLEERIAFLEDALKKADVLLLILGSSFSESIDLLGGRIETALVIGPALPAVTALREARLESIRKGGRKKAFRRVYQIPGMRKVNQAIGRLVRHPGHRAKVLLHGRRFTLTEYQNLLDAEYRTVIVFNDGDTLSHWLAEPPYNDGAGKDPLDPSNSIAFDSARQ